jgi:transposase
MLGPPKPRRLDEPIAVSLENLVPQVSFYRHLEATLDLSFVRDWARELYAERGRPSINPVVFIKLQLVMFFEGLRSERQLITTACLNLLHRWCLGYALDEELPDHFSLTRIRQRLGIDFFQRFFEQIVDRCQEARLVWGLELYFDGTKVEANADFDSLVPRFYHEANLHLGDLITDEVADAGGDDERSAAADGLPSGIMRLPTENDGVALSNRWTDRSIRIRHTMRHIRLWIGMDVSHGRICLGARARHSS